MAQPITSARIGPGHLVVGQIVAGEDLHIAGRLRGSLDSTRTVVIEAGAICEAEITAQRVVIQGVVVGDVQAAGEVVVEPTGQVKGNIRASSVRVQLGGRIESGPSLSSTRPPPRPPGIGPSASPRDPPSRPLLRSPGGGARPRRPRQPPPGPRPGRARPSHQSR